MDENWLSQLDQQTAVLVPTRSLANTLNEQIAAFYVAQGKTVWAAPNILVWQDYLRALWLANRNKLSQKLGVRSLISNQQSLLLWTQVIESSRRQEQALTLLNVQQTARAVQRSWRLINDWCLSVEQIRQDHVADTTQFLNWLEDYQVLLNKRGLLDEPALLRVLCDFSEKQYPYKKLVWYAYDLVTAAQTELNSHAKSSGTEIEQRAPACVRANTEYRVYSDFKSELSAVLQNARMLLEEQPDTKINIVVPDLPLRLTQVREMARAVFYPALSPLRVQHDNTAYRFSLGQSLKDWAAIETALSVLALLKNRTSIADLSFLLRNQFSGLTREFGEQCRAFDRWLKKQRLRTVLFDSLPELYGRYLESLGVEPSVQVDNARLYEVLQSLVEQRQALQARLSEAARKNDFAALAFTDWVGVFDEWLVAWGWQVNTPGTELNTVQHQLRQRWLSLLEEFAGLATVQRVVGLKRAIELLQQMASDTMFLPKAVASPILISGLFEAIGRPAQVCFLTGMNQAFPPAPTPDAFIPARLLVGAGHPDISAQSSFIQASKVNESLLAPSCTHIISYSRLVDDGDIINQASPLYRNQVFTESTPVNRDLALVPLERYQDTQGPAWSDPSRAQGGTKIFENQSNCAFKAFVTHQLGFARDDEPEFGLDAIDRGNIVHRLLDLVWAKLQTQRVLRNKSAAELARIIEQAVDQTISDSSLGLNPDKSTLLKHERQRLIGLLNDWLELEAQRPEPFSVIEREELRRGELEGIKFRYVIDRLDMSDDGRTFIVDYKTGLANRNDWVGERIKRPQLPLYVVALDAIKQKPVAGIAYARPVQNKHEFLELSEANVFRKFTRQQSYEEQWVENRARWESIFAGLARDFISGAAQVNPIDDDTCRYCDLHSVCRVSQLKQTQDISVVQHDS